MGILHLSPMGHLFSGVNEIRYGVYSASESKGIKKPFIMLHLPDSTLEKCIGSEYIMGMLNECSGDNSVDTHRNDVTITIMGADNIVRALPFINQCLENNEVIVENDHPFERFQQFFTDVSRGVELNHDENEDLNPHMQSVLNSLHIRSVLKIAELQIKKKVSSKRAANQISQEDEESTAKVISILSMEQLLFSSQTKSEVAEQLGAKRRALSPTGLGFFPEFRSAEKILKRAEQDLNSEPPSETSDLSSENDIFEQTHNGRSHSRSI